MIVQAVRYHDFCAGHRVVGHENKCANLHGHNYRVYFTVEANRRLDSIGRVLDFSVIKSLLCEWLETNWDHRFLVYSNDPLKSYLRELDPTVTEVPFNPTAENMGQYLLLVVGPEVFFEKGVRLTEVTVQETRKCSATVKLSRLKPLGYAEQANEQ